MKKIIKNFNKYKFLLKELVVRDIKTKYRRSFLGIVWSLLNPLLMMVVITLVFSNLFRFDIENFPIYYLSGQILFSFFSESTNMAMSSIIGNGSLIRKVYIPKYIFPLSKVLSSFVNLIFSLIAILIMMIVTKVKITWKIILFPIPLLYVLIFAIGIGLILAAYSVYFRDIIHLYGVFLFAWIYLTPIFYPINIIPQKYQLLIKMNPMYYMIEYFRQVILYATIPSIRLNCICLFISLYTLSIGLYIFYRKQNNFILYI
jgi:ABC-2 type transport system permease protein